MYDGRLCLYPCSWWRWWGLHHCGMYGGASVPWCTDNPVNAGRWETTDMAMVAEHWATSLTDCMSIHTTTNATLMHPESKVCRMEQAYYWFIGPQSCCKARVCGGRIRRQGHWGTSAWPRLYYTPTATPDPPPSALRAKAGIAIGTSVYRGGSAGKSTEVSEQTGLGH